MTIAFNATSTGWYSASWTSYTFSHTCSGSDRLLVVWFFHWTSDTVTWVTYWGVAMTLVQKVKTPSSSWNYMYQLANPATGANNIVCSASASADWGWSAVSYTGVNQTTPINVSTTNTGTSVSTLTTSVTTTIPNCWLVSYWRNNWPTGTQNTITWWVFRSNSAPPYMTIADKIS